MIRVEEKMIEVLKELKDEYNLYAIKAEFEAEGSRLDELIKLNEIIFKSGINLIIKIGGCEAVRDLDQCRLLGASGVMAPMIETPFAMKKYKGAAEKVYGNDMSLVEWIINAETKTCLEKIDDILEAGHGMLQTVLVGRSDLSASMGIERSQIDGEEIFSATQKFATKAREHGLVVGFGGNIGISSIPFIINMSKFVDRFETRKVVFNIFDDEKQLIKGISKALEFEALYLKNKFEFYNRMANEDTQRIERLKKQLEIAESVLGEK